MRTVSTRRRRCLHVRGIRAGLLFRQRKRRKLLARHQRRQPSLFLLARAEQEQRPDPDRVMRVCEHRSRCAPRADLFQNLAVGPLRKSAAAKFLRRRHPEHAVSRQSIDQVLRNIRLPIDRNRVEMFIEKLPNFRERFVQFRLLRRGNSRIRHCPVGNETS